MAAFIMVLYSLQQAVPAQYVTLSWTLAAAFYLVMNFILNNIKYRWMAICTFIATAIYLFAVDLSSLQVGYRVLAFLFLAVISIAASVYYTKRLRKKNES
jgi:membrane protein implicated in regulation of membrane protease activity